MSWPRPEARPTAADIRDRVAQWWIPETVEFLREIPKTATGKFSKQTLRARNREDTSPRTDQ